MKYLVDVQPKNRVRGNAVKLFTRENGKSVTLQSEIPHLIPSFKEEVAIIDRNLDLLRSNTKGLTFQKVQYKGNAVIWAKGDPAELKEQLQRYNYFLKRESSRIQMLRWNTNFPFTVVTESNGKLSFSKSSVDIPFLQNEKAIALDLEVEGWEEAKRTGDLTKETIAMASFTTMSSFGNYILSIYDPGVKEVKSGDGPNEKAAIILCKDQDDLISKLLKLFQDYDPLWIFGSNVGKYDLLKLREKGNGSFTPSVDGDEPKIEANCGFFPRIGVLGRYVIDSAPFSQNWLWLPRNKLTFVANFLLNKTEEKDMDYDELEDAFKSRDPNKLERAATYNFKDAIISFETGVRILKPVLFISKLFASSPSSVCTTSKKNLGKKIHEKKGFELFHTLQKKRLDEEFDNFDIDKLKYELIEKTCKNESALSIKRGIFRDIDVIYLTPFINAFGSVLQKQECYNELNSLKFDVTDRITISQAFNAFLEKPIFDLNRITKFNFVKSANEINDKQDRAYGYTYGIDSFEKTNGNFTRRNNVQLTNNKVLDTIVQTNKLLRSEEVINYSGKFIFVRCLSNTVKEMEDRGLGISLGKADILSAEKGRVLFKMKDSKSGMILAQDADPTGTKGNRTLFEQELISEFGKLILTDKVAALKFIWDMAKEFAEDKITKEKLVYLEDEVRQDYFNYSAPAQLQERIATYIKYQIMKGESFGYGYGRARKTIGQYSADCAGIIKIPEFLSTDVEVEKLMYLDKWFGPKVKSGRSFSRGTIGDFVYSAFPVTNEADRKELGKIVEGKRDAAIGRFFQEQLNLF